MPTLDMGDDRGLAVVFRLDPPRLDKSVMGCLFDRRTWLGDGEFKSDPALTALVTLRGGAGGKPKLRLAEDAGESACWSCCCC
jgi:hypothetical protein